ncbi:MAG: hypothetical protein JXA67_10545 [Micromonosporaceae bacterium]|nr:hypothetical protein [Micromonosporaceae bacterium]
MDELNLSTTGRRIPRWALPAVGCALIATVATLLLVIQTSGSACATVGVSAVLPQAGPLAVGDKRTGKATHYDANGGGNCSFEATGPGMYVALSPSEYAEGMACGSYLDVTNTRGTVRVKVTDQCPECPSGHIDLSKEAFAKLGALATGVLPVTYRRVDNPGLPGPLTVRIKEGASRYWFAVRIDNHGNQLSKVEVKSGSSWVSLAHTDYNYWLKSDGAGPGPFTLRVTDIVGHRRTVARVTLSPEKVQRTSVRMYSGTGADTAAASPSESSQSPSATAGAPSTGPLGNPTVSNGQLMPPVSPSGSPSVLQRC